MYSAANTGPKDISSTRSLDLSLYNRVGELCGVGNDKVTLIPGRVVPQV